MTTRWNKDGVRHVGGFTLEVFEGFNPHNKKWVASLVRANTILRQSVAADEQAAKREAERLVREDLDRALDDLGDDGREESGGGK